MADDLNTSLEPAAPQDDSPLTKYSPSDLGMDLADQRAPGEETLGAYKPQGLEDANNSVAQAWKSGTGFAQQFKEYFAAKTIERARTHGIQGPQDPDQGGNLPGLWTSNKPSQQEYDDALQTLGLARARKASDDSYSSNTIAGKVAYGASSLARGLAQPENLLQIGGIARSIEGAYAAKNAGVALVQSMLAHGAEAGVTNLAVDSVSQALEIGAGLEDHWSLQRSGMAFGIGGAFGSGMHGAATAIGRILDAREAAAANRIASQAIDRFRNTLVPGEAGATPGLPPGASAFLAYPPEVNRFKPIPDQARLESSNPDIAPGFQEAKDAIASRTLPRQEGDGFDPRSVLSPDDPALQAPPVDIHAGDPQPPRLAKDATYLGQNAEGRPVWERPNGMRVTVNENGEALIEANMLQGPGFGDMIRRPEHEVVSQETPAAVRRQEPTIVRDDPVNGFTSLRPEGMSDLDGEKLTGLQVIPKEDGLHVSTAHLPEDARGQGNGVAMYREALRMAQEQGVPLKSDALVSPDAQRVYDRLAAEGYQVERNPAATVDKDGALVTPDGAPVYTVAPKTIKDPAGAQVEAAARELGVDPATARQIADQLGITKPDQLEAAPPREPQPEPIRQPEPHEIEAATREYAAPLFEKIDALDAQIADAQWRLEKNKGKKAAAAHADLARLRDERAALGKEEAAAREFGELAAREKLQPPVDESTITNPVDLAGTPEQKLAQLNELTAENKPIIDELARTIDERLGTESKSNLKAPENILSKAERPSILKKKPWHGVEHIRDALRFKTVLSDIRQIPEIFRTLQESGISIVKADVKKAVAPKEYGFPIIAFDLRMKNGQLVEYYMQLKEVEEAKKVGHKIFEKWRNLDTDNMQAGDPAKWAEFQADLAESRKLYADAFQAGLERSGADFADVRASLAQVSRMALSDTNSQPSSASLARDTGSTLVKAGSSGVDMRVTPPDSSSLSPERSNPISSDISTSTQNIENRNAPVNAEAALEPIVGEPKVTRHAEHYTVDGQYDSFGDRASTDASLTKFKYREEYLAQATKAEAEADRLRKRIETTERNGQDPRVKGAAGKAERALPALKDKLNQAETEARVTRGLAERALWRNEPSRPTPDMQAHAEEVVNAGLTPSTIAADHAREGDYIGDVVPGLNQHRVTDGAGNKVDVRPVVVELRDLIASDMPGYDQGLQPRNRTDRVQSEEQIRRIINEFDPERLGYASEADRGAPIVGPDRMVESGNGRMMALRQIYESHPQQAQAYRDFLAGLGVDASKYDQPVLVRQRLTELTPDQRVDFTINANKGTTAALGSAEMAAADAKKLTVETLDLIRNPDNLEVAANREFMARFLSKLTPEERAGLQDGAGMLSPAGLTRARNAIIAAAYGDSPILTKLTESVHDEVRGISKALAAAAPEYAKLRAEIRDGLVRPDMDVTHSIIEAVGKAAHLREEGIKLDAHLDQLGMFGNDISDEALDFLRMFYNPKGRRANGVDNITDGLRDYAREARKVSASELAVGLPVSQKKLQEHALEVAHAKFQEDGAQGRLLPLKSRRGGDSERDAARGGTQPGSNPGGPGRGAEGAGLRGAEGGPAGNGANAQLGPIAQPLLAQAMAGRVSIRALDPPDFANLGRYAFDGRDLTLNGQKIGSLKVSVEADARTPHVNIDDISLLPSQQKSGHGSAVIKAIVDEAHAKGYAVSLTSDAMRGKAQQAFLREYYPKLGFVKNVGKDRLPGVKAEFVKPAPELQPMTTRRGAVTSTTPASERIFPQRRELNGEAQKPIAMPAGATPEQIRNLNVTNELMKAANILGRKLEIDGRFTLRGAVGEYKPKMGVLRIRFAGDTQVFAHELGHAIDQRLQTNAATAARFTQIRRQFAKELKPLDANTANPLKQTTEEGVAEFLRMYATNPAYARNQAPGFAAEFEKLLAHDPQVRDALALVTRTHEIRSNMTPEDAMAAQVAPPPARGLIAKTKQTYQQEGLRASLSDLGDTVYASVVAKDHWVGRFVESLRDARFEKAGAPLQAGWKDPYQMFRMLPGAKQAAVDALMNGPRAYGNSIMQGPISAGLHEHLSLALGGRLSRLLEDGDELVQRFNSYLIARRGAQLWDRYNAGQLRNPPIGASEAETRAAIPNLEAQFPNFKQAADGVFAFTRAYWDKKFDAGLIPREVYEAVNAQGADYVPFLRDMSDKKIDGTGGRSSANGVQDNGLRKINGSSRSIVSPIHSIIEDVAQTERMIAQNDTLKALHRLAQSGGEYAGRFLETVPNHELKGTSVDVVEAIKSAARREGADVNETAAIIAAMEDLVGPDMTATVYRASDISPKGERILFYWDGGNRIALKVGNDEISRQFFDVYSALSKPERDIAMAVIGKANSLFSAMVTNAPEFGLKNLVMDNVSRIFIASNTGILGRIPGAAIAAGIHTSLFDREFAKAYAAFGGIRGGQVSQAARVLEQNQGLEHTFHARTMAEMKAELINDWRSPKNIAKTLAMTPFKALEKFQKAIEYTETAGRLGQAKIVFQHLKKQGLSDDDALRGAFYEGRDILDYDRRGGSFGAATKMMPFLNAGIQGTDRALRNLMGTPIKALMEAQARGGLDKIDAASRQALNDAVLNWGMIAAGIGLTAGYTFHMADNPKYQKETDYMRRRYFIFYPGGDDKDGNPMKVTVPKPFDLPGALMSSVESYIYGMIRQDNDTYSTAAKNLLDGFVPRQFMGFQDLAGSLPYAKVLYEELSGNKLGFEGSNPQPIVPQSLKALPPEMQYDAYSSWFSKWVGKQFGVSPKRVEHVMDGLGATTSRDVNAVLTAAIDQNPRMNIKDAMTKFFFGGLYRQDLGGGQARADVMQLMAQDNGTYTQLANGYRKAIETGDQATADMLFNRANETAKTLMVLNSDAAFKPDMRALHPLVRTEKVGEVASAVLRDLAGGKLSVEDRSRKRGQLRETIDVSPAEARAISATMTSYMAEEMRNGLAAAKEPGYQTYALIDTTKRLEAIRALNPDVADEIQARLDKRRVIPIDKLATEWPRVKSLILSDRAASAKDLARTYKELSK